MGRRPNTSPQTRLLLAALAEAPQAWRHGYELAKVTGLKSGTLYPLLMRLHEQGLLEAEWREADVRGRPPRHAYRLTGEGVKLAAQATGSDPARASAEWSLGRAG